MLWVWKNIANKGDTEINKFATHQIVNRIRKTIAFTLVSTAY